MEGYILSVVFIYIWMAVAVGWRYETRNGSVSFTAGDPYVILLAGTFWPITVTIAYFISDKAK